MAQVAQARRPPKFVALLLDKLKEGLKQGGIQADVDSEAVQGTKLYRVMVVSRNFEHVRQGERQELVWRIADSVLAPEQQLRISMILTVTPAEITGATA